MALRFKPIWFDSLGAKSACTLVQTPDVTIVIDPGIAAMQPGFPASERQKKLWKAAGKRAIKRALKKAQVVVISHYHHDHYLPDEVDVYAGKMLLAKNPNAFINESQRVRAEKFFGKLAGRFGGTPPGAIFAEPAPRTYADPMEKLPLSREKDFGDYNRRRKEVLRKGLDWFTRIAETWCGLPVIPEINSDELRVQFPEGRHYRFGETTVRFSEPLFHGVEYSRLGWVFATVIEYRGKKLLHSSDLSGPVIEDYAQWIIQENPDILILDGPMTYMFGYLVTRTNLERAIDNAIRILREIDAELVLYDHHLPREAKFREHTAPVWQAARQTGAPLMTAAEYLGKTPRVLEGEDEKDLT